MKRSPFFSEIVAHGPAVVGVQGWEVANQFTIAEEEHRAVRERVGLFDWSTTGEFEVQGPDALALVQKMIVNDASMMGVNRVLYTSILNEDGGMMSDITVYRLAPDRYMLMTAWGSNAANDRPEYELLLEHGRGMNVAVTDVSSGVGLLAIQGPQSKALLSELTDADLDGLKYMWATPAQVIGVRALISRTGYTGEIGYEVLIPSEHAHDFWVAVTTAGAKYGLALCGMIAAFSLRIEKGYIMRFDFAGGRTPYEVGLGWTVKLDKGDFIGRQALIQRKEAGFKDNLMALVIQDGYVPAAGDAIFKEGDQVGEVTSGAFGYTLGRAVALGYVPLSLAHSGVNVLIRDQEQDDHPAVVGVRPLYDPAGARLRK
ncbi:MAG: aminomethyltransferase family protein [Chloroflexota bacterium]|nr:aminomethyltransferase family protein [Chloroflexota bacterium]